MKKITDAPAWQALQAHHKTLAGQRMQDWFSADCQRYTRFSLGVNDLLLDYSKNHILPETLKLLADLAHAANLPAKIEALFNGQPINTSENRPVLHTALRDQTATPIVINGENIAIAITQALAQMGEFTKQVRNGSWLGATGKPIRDIVNIGIGGSHLGPMLATHALADFVSPDLHCHFIANIDAADAQAVLALVNPETTLFIVSSKSFTTLETLTNARSIKNWLQQKLGTLNVESHFVAVTANAAKAMEFGIPAGQIFPVWEWVGGRYSVWSAIGLPLALLIGMENFTAFLQGAHRMDEHFRHADFTSNMPVIMALLGIWYINFFAANSQAIVPYSHHLTHLRTYLQQADMESNGKSISQTGSYLGYATGPIIWGEQGSHAQHAFHQLLHQGQHFIPVDFILTANVQNDFAHHHDILVASGLSQAQALMQGKTYEDALAEALAADFNLTEAQTLAQHKMIPGNRPSNILFLNKITPHNLGMLLALYEHKIFVQGAIWDINSFGQWGVELGKQLLPQILCDLKNPATDNSYDSSTQGLILHYKNLRSEPST